MFVFLDEVNAAPHLGIFMTSQLACNSMCFAGLVTEAICHRSLNGQPIRPEITIVCACNPYRRRSEVASLSSAGLLPPSSAVVTESSELEGLVYRVHPLPATLLSFVFDFGSLDTVQEKGYIELMARAHLGDLLESEAEFSTMVEVISSSQSHLRGVYADTSVVSLRDVKRVIFLLRWFVGTMSNKGTLSAVMRSLILGLNHVYHLRLPTPAARATYWNLIRTSLEQCAAAEMLPSGMGFLISNGKIEAVVRQAQNAIASRMIIEPGISMNQVPCVL